jgi:hypothetical protein
VKTEFSLKLGMRQACLFLPLLLSAILSRAIKQEKEVKVIQIRKEEVKFCLFVNDMMLYVKDLKESSGKTLRSDKHFQQRSGYKINIQKLEFAYTPTMNSLKKKSGTHSHSQ